MKLPTISEVNFIAGTRILVRTDFNVPINDGKVGSDEDWRIVRALPTIEYLIKRGAKVILATHLGRPEGKKVAELKLDIVAERLSKLLRRPVQKLDDCVGPKVASAIEDLDAGGVCLLENLRFNPGEDNNDVKFAQELACLADIYVNDAFAVSHRKAASICAITGFLPSYAGMLLESEIKALTKVMKHPARPYLVVMGGAKVSTKIGAIEKMLEIADRVLLGGALANAFFQAQGYGIGASLTSPEDVAAAKKILESPHRHKLILPGDVIVGDPERPLAHAETVEIHGPKRDLAQGGRAILDIGPHTVSAYSSFLRSAKTIVWNGPMGWFESPRFAHGTLALGRLIAARSKGRTFGVVGGGESVMALRQTGLEDCIDHVSTGGGAMLEFLEDRELPGIEALINQK